MKIVETMDWSESINGWYDGLNDASEHDLKCIFEYLDAINEEEGYE